MAGPMVKYLVWSLVLIGIMSKGILDMILLALNWYLSHPILLQQSKNVNILEQELQGCSVFSDSFWALIFVNSRNRLK